MVEIIKNTHYWWTNKNSILFNLKFKKKDLWVIPKAINLVKMDIKLQCALCKIWVNFDKVVFRPDLFENPSNFQNCEICETCDKKN